MSARAARFGAALAMLWAAHDLADHVVQTDHQAQRKAHADPNMWIPAMAGHVTGYQATQAVGVLALRGLGVRPGPGRMVAAMALSAGTHALLDRRWPVVGILHGTGSAAFSRPQVRVDVRGAAHRAAIRGASTIVEAEGRGPLPLHGPYLADQALHHAVLAAVAWILAGGRQP